jgi:hypothetical protein
MKPLRVRTLSGQRLWVLPASLADHTRWPLLVPVCTATGNDTGLFVLRAYIDRVG